MVKQFLSAMNSEVVRYCIPPNLEIIEVESTRVYNSAAALYLYIDNTQRAFQGYHFKKKAERERDCHTGMQTEIALNIVKESHGMWKLDA